ncbi:hypothetical protein BDY19DRAFT_973992 [Irpex rosettiformis]|uniref:Uncharacterized protein n=1 Tax=Irpex rosettiformis TaxID=378272 RepID=A0ACB8TQ40_9APHY|nr:hypothetical protein BDY19DRAFT_973992 [Irpex rosettiformis]
MAFRRGNKSNKVPNVKLRPALPNTTRKSKRYPSDDALHSHDSGFDSQQDNSLVDMHIPRPFRGIVLCATGITDKMALFKQAIELGAQPLNDLTDRVTHLLAREPGSAKYKCAVENNITIMHPSWVEDSYEIWLKGDDVNLKECIAQHRLPIFNNVTLSLSGIEDEEKKEEIIRRVQEEGGSYVENIKRPVKVTHLLCTSSINDPTDQMRYAAKFNRQREADIKMVWLEWFWDCLKVGGRCDEEAYNISSPRPFRKATPEATTSPPCSSSPDNRLSEAPQDDGITVTRRGNVVSDDKEEEEAAMPIKVAPALTNQIWGVLLKNRGFDARSGKLIRNPIWSRETLRNAGNVEDTPTKPKPKRSNLDRTEKKEEAVEQQFSILKSLRRGHAYVASDHVLGNSAVADSSAQPTVPEDSRTSIQPVMNVAGSSSGGQPNHSGSFFSGLTFRLLGEAKSSHVKASLEEAGGLIVSDSSDDSVDFIIVRLVSGSKLYREEVDESSRSIYRTECWLERCFSECRVCSVDEHVSFTPLRVAETKSMVYDLTVSISGLEEAEACWVRRLLRALGANFAPSFSRRTTHLLCPSKTGAKHDKALEWNIPIVDMDWLVCLAGTGQVPPFQTPLGPQAQLDTIAVNSKSKLKASEPPPDETLRGFNKPTGIVDDDSADSFGEPIGLLPEQQNAEDTEPTCAKGTDTDSRPLSLAELREDMLSTHIPSSETPSPIKRPSASPSPAKISREATRVLQESITTLLGKRMSSEDNGSGQAPRPKRVRPPSRTKAVPSRDDVLPVLHPATISRESYEPFGVGEDASMLAVAVADEDVAVRVTYEDPVQNSEKMRLMKLLETQKPPDIWDLDSHSTVEGSEVTENAPTASRRRRQPRRSTRTGGS